MRDEPFREILPVKLALLPLPPLEFPPIVIVPIVAELERLKFPLILELSFKVILPIWLCPDNLKTSLSLLWLIAPFPVSVIPPI